MSVSSITSTASTPTYTTTGNAAATTPAPAPAPTSTSSVTMSTLAQQAGIVATLGSATSEFQTYDATGLLNQVAQASNAAAAAQSSTPAAAAPSGQGTSADPSAPSSPSSDTSVAAAVPGDWGTILKSNPALTSVAVADAVAQGIVNTINVYA
jgi:hypothetical protein